MAMTLDEQFVSAFARSLCEQYKGRGGDVTDLFVAYATANAMVNCRRTSRMLANLEKAMEQYPEYRAIPHQEA